MVRPVVDAEEVAVDRDLVRRVIELGKRALGGLGAIDVVAFQVRVRVERPAKIDAAVVTGGGHRAGSRRRRRRRHGRHLRQNANLLGEERPVVEPHVVDQAVPVAVARLSVLADEDPAPIAVDAGPAASSHRRGCRPGTGRAARHRTRRRCGASSRRSRRRCRLPASRLRSGPGRERPRDCRPASGPGPSRLLW